MFFFGVQLWCECFFWCAKWFKITEWEPCTWLLNTDILVGNAVRQWHCWSR